MILRRSTRRSTRFTQFRMPTRNVPKKIIQTLSTVEPLASVPRTPTPTPQKAPILTLPVEIIQEITSFLDSAIAASFSLTTRYIYYAIGTAPLQTHLCSSSISSPYASSNAREPPLWRFPDIAWRIASPAKSSRIEGRKRIEILERAFPSHWYCAWCDTFHEREVNGGPGRFREETRRDCAEFNSFLHNGWEFVVCFHHVRLAINRQVWGYEHGIGLEVFNYTSSTVQHILGVALGVEHDEGEEENMVKTWLQTEARIIDSRLILHATYLAEVRKSSRPSTPRALAALLIPTIPHIVVGHRDSHDPHTNFLHTLETSLSLWLRHIRSNSTQMCAACATDFCITTKHHSSNGKETGIFLEIEVWRDLGDGRNPFDTSWRAHGELGSGKEGVGGDAFGIKGGMAGYIRGAFEEGNRC